MDKAAQRKAERERRQERIRQSSGNRLAKITGVAGSQDFKKPVETREKTAPAELRMAPQTAGPQMQDDPLFAMLAGQMPSQPGAESREEHFGTAQKRAVARADVEFGWDIVHLVVSVALGFYMALCSPWNIGAAFASAEGVMIATKLVLGHQNSGFAAISMLAPFLGMLPKNRQRQIGVLGALANALRTAYRDMAIALLVYGCASGGGRAFARPASVL